MSDCTLMTCIDAHNVYRMCSLAAGDSPQGSSA